MSVKHDYKSRDTWNNDPRWKTRQQVRRRGLLVTALALIGLIGGIVGYVRDHRQEAAVATQSDTARQAHRVAPEQSQPLPPRPKPKYEFYERLLRQEVAIRDDEMKQRKRVKPADPQPIKPEIVNVNEGKNQSAGSASGGTRAFIQTGSFHSAKEADRAKAELALLGIRAHIDKITDTKGTTWNKVRLGPYNDRNKLQAMRQQLRNSGIDAITVEIKSTQ